MVNLLNKKKMTVSNEQGKCKKKRVARVRIQTLQTKILDLQVGMSTPPSEDDSEYYRQMPTTYFNAISYVYIS